MREIGPEHPVTYRKEAATQFFDHYVRAGESCVIVGVAGGGMRRFVDFLARTDVQEHYLGDLTNAPLLLKVDCNRIHDVSEWGLCELMLTALVEGCNLRPHTIALQPEINSLRMDVIMSQKNALLAQRHLELAVDILIKRANAQIYFLLSEFDRLFASLPDLVLDHLRAVRDANKYTVNFALCLYRYPEQLRPVLKDKLSARIAQNVLTVGMYPEQDANRMIDQLEARRGKTLSPGQVQKILHLSGRHAGLIHGIYSSLVSIDENAAAGEISENDLLDWLVRSSNSPTPAMTPAAAMVECERLWEALPDEEKDGLLRVANHKAPPPDVMRLLVGKELLRMKDGRPVIFSPLFERFVRLQGEVERVRFLIDENARLIYIGERVIGDISPLVFKLLVYLYRNVGKVCEHDDIITEVYSGQDGVSDASLASLVRQARAKIEPPDSPYMFLVNVRGVGYKLLEYPEIKEPDVVLGE